MRPTDDPYAYEAVAVEGVTVRKETDKAILCTIPDLDGEEIWVPKSQIKDESEVYSLKSGKEPGKLVIPKWLADEKGLG